MSQTNVTQIAFSRHKLAITHVTDTTYWLQKACRYLALILGRPSGLRCVITEGVKCEIYESDERNMFCYVRKPTTREGILSFDVNEPLLPGLTLFPIWIIKYTVYKVRDELMHPFWTTTVKPKFGNGRLNASHTMLGMWLFIHAGIKHNFSVSSGQFPIHLYQQISYIIGAPFHKQQRYIDYTYIQLIIRPWRWQFWFWRLPKMNQLYKKNKITLWIRIKVKVIRNSVCKV